MSLTSGSRLGAYEILAPLGAGGMGEVYRARDTKLGREVAIKVLPEAFSQDPEKLARFQREAHLLASLNHPNVATLYGLEESNGQQFLVMELVEGETLAECLASGPMRVEDALPLFQHIAEGLEAAHEKGIVHRDLKPSNIKIAPDGKPKILDFGLAKAALRGDVSVESPTITREGTEPGIVLGTAAYMSPEQARGRILDKRTDIWAFGCVLHEALTGKVTFLGETVSDTIAAILGKEPDWSALPAATPALAKSLLRRCLQKDPVRRLHDIADARIEIEEALSEPLGGSPSPAKSVVEPPFRRRALPWGLALLSTIAIGISVFILRSGASRELPPLARVSIQLPPPERLAPHFRQSAVAISPDGSQLVYLAEREGTRRLYLRALDQSDATPLPDTEGAANPFFSPVGDWVGFFADGKLKKISVTGGKAITLCEATQSWGATWAPDDTIIFPLFSHEGLWRVSADGGTPEVLTSPDPTKGESAHYWPEILPGGKAVLYNVYMPDDVTTDDARIAVLSLETGEQKTLLEGGAGPRYAPTGHLVYARAGSLRALKLDLERLEVTEPSVQVLDGVRTYRNGGAPQFAFARNGTLVYVPGGTDPDRTLVWVSRKGVASPITQDERGYFGLTLSPGGQRIALVVGWLNHNVWSYDLSRGTFSPLTYRWDEHGLAWMPDGKRVLFGSNRGGRRNVFWKSADGSGDVEQLLESDYNQNPRSVSPDGKVLAFEQSRPSTGWDIWLLPMEGKNREPREFLATEFDERSSAFSPDGRWIAFESNESGRSEVYVRPFPGPGAGVPISTEGGRSPVWSANGRELFYRYGDQMMAAAVETEAGFDSGPPRLLFEGRYRTESMSYDVSPDGERFLMIREPETQDPTHLNVVFNWFSELERLVPKDN